jgi:hypothetical protein
VPWTPSYPVTNARAIAENLLAYFEANQADALVWAGGSLKPLKKFSQSLADRTVPAFPSIAFSDDNDATDYATSTAAQGAYSLTFEVSVQSLNGDTATTQARRYSLAIVSMIRNCPKATLIANTGCIQAVVDTIEIGFDPIRAHENRKNDFLQVFQVRTTFILQVGN